MTRILLLIIALVGLTGVAQSAPGDAPGNAGKIQLTWLGHATFIVVSPGGTRLMIDPFIMGNPKTPKAHKTLELKLDAIVISHAHGDHASDAVELAKKSGATVIGAHDYVKSLKIPDGQKMGGNVGGKIKIKDVTVHLVPAMHGSQPGGRPLGLIIEFADGRSIYHTGDTWIFGDMSLIQEIYSPDIILLQTGGGPYNQDPKTAALAISKFFTPKVIVPMHYGTFPVLADEAAVKAAFKGDKRLKIMAPGVPESL
jgi:L-ascorbate metabolism protein UlaG (beta-lactamase superfamily)